MRSLLWFLIPIGIVLAAKIAMHEAVRTYEHSPFEDE